MKVQLVGKFFDNHSLSIINRNLAKRFADKFDEFSIYALDTVPLHHTTTREEIKFLFNLDKKELDDSVDIQVRHNYPPLWSYPKLDSVRLVFIQPWEYSKMLMEWQYKFESFADSIIVPSQFIGGTLTRGGIDSRRLHIIPNGYDKTVFHDDNSKDENIPLNIDKTKCNFVYVGNPQWRKGLDILMNVWKQTFKAYDNARLIIIDNPAIYGESNVLNEVVKAQYINECGRIIYSDKQLTTEDLAKIYRASEYIVHPYRAEGFGMHIQEAVACGCVPIVSRNGPTDEFIHDEGSYKINTQSIMVDIEDPALMIRKPGDAFANMSMHTIVNEPSAQELHSALLTAYSSRDNKPSIQRNTLYDWESVADSYAESFKTTLSQPIVRRTM